MGIINATPDSFYAGSRRLTVDDILRQAGNMLDQGATFLDIGGYSSRPGAKDVSIDDEIKRVVEPIDAIVKRFPEAIISIDTFRSEVAKRAVDSGASVVNDISAGNLDNQMLNVVAELSVPYIAMHMKGTPQTMKELVNYDNLVVEVVKYFSSVLDHCNHLGIKDVLIDPGFGFAKTTEQSFELLNKLEYFEQLSRPLLVGVSRKSMIYRSLEITAEEALNGTTVLNTVALFKGAAILRVHDVKEAVEAVKLISQLN